MASRGKERRQAAEIGIRILEGVLQEAIYGPPTFEHEDLSHRIAQHIRLPKEYHDRKTRLAPVQIQVHHDPHALVEKDGRYINILSGQWKKYIPDPELPYRLAINNAPKEAVDYETIGRLHCHPDLPPDQALPVGMAWLQTFCSVVTERPVTAHERYDLEYNRPSWEPHPDQIGFYYGRSLEVPPKRHPLQYTGQIVSSLIEKAGLP